MTTSTRTPVGRYRRKGWGRCRPIAVTALVVVCVVWAPVLAGEPAPVAPTVPAKTKPGTMTVAKARAMAKAACATAEPLITPFADAVTRFAESVKDASQDRIEALKAELVELQAAANAPSQATDAATYAYKAFSKLANRRRTISHKDLALAARFKSVRYTMRKATRALASAAQQLLAPPPEPAAPKP